MVDEAELDKMTLRMINEQLAKHRAREANSEQKHIPREKDIPKAKSARLQVIKEAVRRYMQPRDGDDSEDEGWASV